MYDAETGLYDNGLRTYDPRTGRFLESDPTGLSGGVATYAYARQSPLLFVDPVGLWKISGSLYDGIGGGFSISWDKSGFAACAEVGVGEGVDASYSPNAPADDSHVYAEASYKMTAGPYSEELKAGIESSPCGPKITGSGTLSYGPGSVEGSVEVPVNNPSAAEGRLDPQVSLNPADWKAGQTEVSDEAKAVVGACHHF